MVLTPKGNADTRGIGLLEVIWKVVLGVANFRIGATVDFNDMLHGLITDRGTWTASLEVKLLHQLMEIREEVL